MGKNCSSPLFSGVPSSLFPNSTFSIFTDSLYFCFSFLSPMLSHRYLHAFSTVSTIFSTALPALFFPFHFFTFFKPAFPVQCNSFFACLCDLFDFFTNPQPLLLLLFLYFSFFYSFPAIFTFMQIHLLKSSSIACFTPSGDAYLLKKDNAHSLQSNQKKYSDSNYFTVFARHTPLFPFYKTSKASQNETFLKL